ncbi:hypothetical protein GCM10007874_41570 [Labrys miyagiensis]|uniref:Uncharacterized protein n=1 Tax=Labrys miyagiensis TaxID=346912 RepID=A0ABQ6CLU8_9HYPH|nr:hypothetical protein [Labrys miyagiensis]GLS21140.1 hypothetical protein GCM10007874_41570 [Labrys miyagiensis]
MGYELHITRKENWFDEAPDITPGEWLAFVGGDSEMRHDGFAEAPVGGGKMLRIESEDISVWTAYSGGASGRNTAWITWSNGNIVAKNPDREIRQKMWRIAQFFDAKVQGDDGELYGKDGETIEVIKPTRVEPRSDTPAVSPRRPW